MQPTNKIFTSYLSPLATTDSLSVRLPFSAGQSLVHCLSAARTYGLSSGESADPVTRLVYWLNRQLVIQLEAVCGWGRLGDKRTHTHTHRSLHDLLIRADLSAGIGKRLNCCRWIANGLLRRKLREAIQTSLACWPVRIVLCVCVCVWVFAP